MRFRLMHLSLALVATAVGGALLWSRAKEDVRAGQDRADAARVRPGQRAALGRWAGDQAAEVARVAKLRRDLRGAARRAALVELLSELAVTDPELATQLAGSLAEEEGRIEALHECLPAWLASDPDRATSFLLTAVQTASGETAQALTREAAAHDPALGYTVALEVDPSVRRAAMRDVFSAWAASDPEAASHVVAQLSRGNGYLVAVEEVGRLWAQQDAHAAFAWGSALPASDARRSALFPIIEAWAGVEPSAAARSIETLAPEPWRRRLIDDVVEHWASADTDGALAWTRKLGDPLEREAATTTVLLALQQSQPERAAALARELDRAQGPVLDKVVAAWSARDPNTAARWLRAHPGAHADEGTR